MTPVSHPLQFPIKVRTQSGLTAEQVLCRSICGLSSPMAAEPLGIATSFIAAVVAVRKAADLVRNLRRQPRKFGLTIHESPLHPEVDIVLVHGLGVDSTSAWTETSTADGKTRSLRWPLTELPKKLVGVRARIITYDYDSKFRTPEYLTRRTLLHQTGRLVEELAQFRRNNSALPIVFVCHSLGGIVVKNALVNARSSKEHQDIFRATIGVVFLGTPHDSSPAVFANNICSIVGLAADDKIQQELRDRSVTLAYSLERFKPLAAYLDIRVVAEAPPPDVDQTPPPYVDVLVKRDHRHLCRFLDPEDENLKHIIDLINDVCAKFLRGETAGPPQLESPRQGRSAANPPLQKADGIALSPLGHGGGPSTHVEPLPAQEGTVELTGKPQPPKPPQLTRLENFFGRWWPDGEQHQKDARPDGESRPKDAWPVAVLYGVAGCGKSELARQYIHLNLDKYSSIFWINASNEKSIELSFQEVSRRIAALDDPKTIKGRPYGDQDPDGKEELHILVQKVTEWLEQPREKPWLLVLDDLSRESPYPSSAVWTSKRSERKSWRELLRLIPSTTGSHGHVIISTRDHIDIPGLTIITFDPPKSELAVGMAPFEEPSREVAKWWETATSRRRSVLALVLLMSDQQCPQIPLYLLREDFPEADEIGEWRVPELSLLGGGDNQCIVLSDALLKEGPRLLVNRAQSSFVSMAEGVAADAWGILSKRLETPPDAISNWDRQARLVRNVTATLTRCRELIVSDALPKDYFCKCPGKGASWADMASVCECHSAYTTAKKLFKLERKLTPHKHLEATKSKLQDLKLQLDYARVCQRAGNYQKAEEVLEKVSQSQADLPREFLEATRRQFASLLASQGRYSEAASKLSEVLEEESPFSRDASKKEARETVSDLAMYLIKSGNRPAASFLLQRVLLSFEDSQGNLPLPMLCTMEALSAIKQEEGELDDAYRLLSSVHDCQGDRLGDEHPSTVICWSKMAAVLDLEGQQPAAVEIYNKCLPLATKGLGPRHPSVFGIRENLARCLLAQGKTTEAAEEFKLLEDEITSFPGMYPSAVKRRIKSFLSGPEKMDDYELDEQLAKRNTLGVKDLYDDEDGEDSDDTLGEFGL